jgi:restriction system protein
MVIPPHRPRTHPAHYRSANADAHRILASNRQQRRRAIAAILGSHAPPTQRLLLQALVEVGDRNAEGVLIEAVALPWYEILSRIQREPAVLDLFAQVPRKFEEFLAACYKQAGYDVILTPPSGDLGIDVIVCATIPGLGSIRFVDQAKAYSPTTPVPAKDVRELAGVLQIHPEITKGVITTTSTFAPGVADEFKNIVPTRIELKDRSRLLDWLAQLPTADIHS